MGTLHSMECHHQVLKIWEWAIIHKNHLSAAHIPGKLNTVADKESRSNHVGTEWMLQTNVLNLALEHLSFKPKIDLLATNINTQFGKYAVFRSDSGAMYIDAFSIDWSDLKFYAFPPIPVIPRVLSKVKQDSAEGIIVVPFWPTQAWYPTMLKMLVSTAILLNSRKSLLVLPQTPTRYIQCGKRGACCWSIFQTLCRKQIIVKRCSGSLINLVESGNRKKVQLPCR